MGKAGKRKHSSIDSAERVSSSRIVETEPNMQKKSREQTPCPGSKSEVEKLTSVQDPRTNGDEQSSSVDTLTGDECALCLESTSPRERNTFPCCSSMFHDECIGLWMKKCARCPVCETKYVTSVQDLRTNGDEQSHSADTVSGDECALCLQSTSPNERNTFPCCSSMFHDECIGPWMKKCAKCPVCETKYVTSVPDPRTNGDEQSHSADTLTGDECALCLHSTSPNERKTLQCCSTTFHEACIDLWMKKCAQCPVCEKQYVASIQNPHSSEQNRSPSVDSSTGYECALCLQSTSPNERKIFPCCSSTFHQACIELWVKHYARCPTCEEQYLVSYSFNTFNAKIDNVKTDMRLHNGFIDMRLDNGDYISINSVGIDMRMNKDGIEMRLDDGGIIRCNEGTFDIRLNDGYLHHSREGVQITLDSGGIVNLNGSPKFYAE